MAALLSHFAGFRRDGPDGKEFRRSADDHFQPV
jgi:hypothetical protein